MTAGWLDWCANTVTENQVLPGSHHNPQLRQPANQTAGTSLYTAGRQGTSHSEIHPAYQHSTQCTHPASPSSMAFIPHPPPPHLPGTKSQLNLVLSDPWAPKGTGTANQRHTSKLDLYIFALYVTLTNLDGHWTFESLGFAFTLLSPSTD